LYQNPIVGTLRCRVVSPPSPPAFRALTTPTAYVDDHLIATGKISKAAIVGKQGGIWAQSAGYNVRTELGEPLALGPLVIGHW
jgi:hypothetical protein